MRWVVYGFLIGALPVYSVIVPRYAVIGSDTIKKITRGLAVKYTGKKFFFIPRSITGCKWMEGNKEKILKIVSDGGWHRLVYSLTERTSEEVKELWTKSYGKYGDGPGKFIGPEGICVDTTFYSAYPNDIFIYVCDEGNDRVVKLRYNKLDEEIHYVGEILCPFEKFVQIRDINCVTVKDGEALLVITDGNKEKLFIYNTKTNDWKVYKGIVGTQKEFLIGPCSAVIDKVGDKYYIFVTEKRLGVIKLEMDEDGNIEWVAERKFSRPLCPYLSINPVDRLLYAVSPGEDKIYGIPYNTNTDFKCISWTYGKTGYGEGEFYAPWDIGIVGGEAGVLENWGDSSGIQYFWLDCEVRNASCNPNVFNPAGICGTIISYTLTGGAFVDITINRLIYTPTGPIYIPVRVLEDHRPRYAGRHNAFWDGKDANGNQVPDGQYFIIIKATDFYEGEEDYKVNDKVIIPVWVVSAIPQYFYTGFEDGHPVPSIYEISPQSPGITDIDPEIVGAEQGVIPHSGDRMLKIEAEDVGSDNERDSFWVKIFDDVDIEITKPMFLSFWLYNKEDPTKRGYITVDGKLENGIMLSDWRDYGYIIGRNSKRLKADCHTCQLNSGWNRYIFALTPAVGEVIEDLRIVYIGEPGHRTGKIRFYVDDIEIASEYPELWEWYPEIFATGSSGNDRDCNFELGFYVEKRKTEESFAYPLIQIKVDGHGDYNSGNNCCECKDEDDVWIKPFPGPSIRIKFPTPPKKKSGGYSDWLPPDTKIAWYQYDKAHALVLGFLLQPEYSEEPKWLYYAWNAENHWDRPGWVDMSDEPFEHMYNTWQGPFIRELYPDFISEYGDLGGLVLLDARITHFCKSSWEGDKGGIVKQFFVGSEDDIIIDTITPLPDPPKDDDYAVVDDPIIKTYSFGSYYPGPLPPNGAELYLSRDGGKNYDELLKLESEFEYVPVDSMEIDGEMTYIYGWKGTHATSFNTGASKNACFKLVITDSAGNTWEGNSNNFEIHMASALSSPLEGSSHFNVNDSGFGIVYTTRGAQDTTQRYILYTYSLDGIKWSRISSATRGIFPCFKENLLFYISEDTSSIHLLKRETQDWSEDIHVEGGLDTKIKGLDFTLSEDTIYLVYSKIVPLDTFPFFFTSINLLKLLREDPSQKYSVPLSFFIGRYEISPLIEIGKDSSLHILFRKEDTLYYLTYKNGIQHMEKFLSDTSFEPSLSVTEGNVYIVYKKDGKIKLRIMYPDGKLTKEFSYEDESIKGVRLLKGNVFLYEDEVDSISSIMLSSIELEDEFLMFPLRISERGYSAWDGEGKVVNKNDSLKIFTVWTEKREGYRRIAYDFIPLDFPLVSYYILPGSFYLRYAWGQDSLDGKYSDVSYDSLVYFIPYVSFWTKEICIHLVSDDSAVVLIEISSSQDTVMFYGSTYVRKEVPPDNGFYVKIKKISGSLFGVSKIVIESWTTGGEALAGYGGIQEVKGIPLIYAFYAGFPNPFTDKTLIKYSVPEACHVSIRVYDASGRMVKRVVDREVMPGIYVTYWDGKDERNFRVSSGVYFIRMDTKKYKSSKKVVLIK